MRATWDGILKGLRGFTALALVVLPTKDPARSWVALPDHGSSTAFELRGPGNVTTVLKHIRAFRIEGPSDGSRPLVAHGWHVIPTVLVKALAIKVPNDPLYNQQWFYLRTQSPMGWSATTGLNGPIIADIDSGVDLTHPDLQGVIIGGMDNVPGTTSYQDQYMHGTHTTGLIGASSNNNVGVTGQDWAARILAVRVLDAQGQGDDALVEQGMEWSVDNGAKVLSMSLGSDANSVLFQQGVAYAQSKGCLVVASSGNGGGNDTYYPGATPGVLEVGATDQNDARAYYSSYNSNLQVMAPGGAGDGLHDILSTDLGGGYSSGAGTSYSVPQASAAAALYWTLHPTATAAEVAAAITSTADPIAEVPGWDTQTGWGRLNVARLLGQPAPPSVFLPTTPPYFIAGNGVTLTVGCGAGEPIASPLFPTPPAITRVWVEFQDLTGNVLATSDLVPSGPRTYSGSLYTGLYTPVSLRTVQFVYKAVDNLGNTGVAWNIPTAVQYPGTAPQPGVTPTVAPSPAPAVYLAHSPPNLYILGMPVTLTALATGTNPITQVQVGFEAYSGSTMVITKTAVSPGPDVYNVTLGPSDLGQGIRYWWTAWDSVGNTATIPGSGGTYSLLPTNTGSTPPSSGVLPNIIHTPPNSALVGQPVNLSAVVIPGLNPLYLVTVTYLNPQLGWMRQSMVQGPNNTWTGTIAAPQAGETSVYYYLTGVDTMGGQASAGSQGNPLKVPVITQTLSLLPAMSPSVNHLAIRIVDLDPAPGRAIVRFYTLSGELVEERHVQLQDGTNLVSGAKQPADGLYIIEVSADGHQTLDTKAALVH